MEEQRFRVQMVEKADQSLHHCINPLCFLCSNRVDSVQKVADHIEVPHRRLLVGYL